MRASAPVSSPSQQRGIVDTEEAAHGEQRRGSRGAQDVGRLAALEARVHRDEDGPGAQGAQRGQHPLGTIGGPDGDPVGAIDAGRDETAGVEVHRFGQLGVGEADVPVDHGLVAGMAKRALRDQIRDGPPGQIGPGILVAGRRPADARAVADVRCVRGCRHGCWLDTEMTSPLMYDE
jgi:hypothetical protein